jgi:negative regulator of sigma E activity
LHSAPQQQALPAIGQLIPQQEVESFIAQQAPAVAGSAAVSVVFVWLLQQATAKNPTQSTKSRDFIVFFIAVSIKFTVCNS